MTQTTKDRRDLASEKARQHQERAREALKRVEAEALEASDQDLARLAEAASQIDWARLGTNIHGRIAAHLISAAIDAALPEQHYMTTGDAAETLGVSINTLKKWVRLGLIRDAYRTSGGHLRVSDADVARVAELNNALEATPDLRPLEDERPAPPWSR